MERPHGGGDSGRQRRRRLPEQEEAALISAPRSSGSRRTLAAWALHEARRDWRCLRRRWSSHGVRFVSHDAYQARLPGVPRDELRAQRILAFLLDEGLVNRHDIDIPRRPSMRNLLGAHTASYLETVEHSEVLLRVFGVPLTEAELEAALDTQRLMVGGTIQATRLALANRGVAVNLGGGLHHAHRNSGLSFCVFNDVAVAITRLRARGFKGNILVVDLDLHDGNGTRAIFAHDPTVHTYSIHNEHWGDTEAEGSTSIALGPGVTDESYLGTLLKTLPQVADDVDPALVIYLAGTDAAADDRLGNWRISATGLLNRDRFVFDLFRKRQRPVPLVVLLAGGYGDNSWRHTARSLSYLLAGKVIEPPATEELVLLHFQQLRASLDPSALTSEPGDYSWGLDADDLVGLIPGQARVTRFLGYFSVHGLELIFERLGIFDHLRVRGFAHPTLSVDASDQIGQTLRIHAEPDRRELLVELRVSRDQRRIPGAELLVIEWLLLQHPRAGFGPYRRPLPGQKHPGLGLLKEMFGSMVVMCEMLHLDGIYFVPSSYHVAAQSRRLVSFVDPVHEALFRAWTRALEPLALAAASQAVSTSGVIDGRTGQPLAWEGLPMILPVSSRLKDQVNGADYERHVQLAAEHLPVEPKLVAASSRPVRPQ